MSRAGPARQGRAEHRHVVVIGGGLAGLTAALRCRDAGAAVTLLEARPRLGGATCSFRRGELTVDNGQHAFLRCYTSYRGLLGRLSVAADVDLQDRFDVPVLTPGSAPVRLRRRALPAPAHLLPALLGHRLLRPGERLRAMRTAQALRRLDPDDPGLDERSFGDWLRAHRETRRGIDTLWGLLTVAALNAEPDQASLALAARVFRTGLLDTADGADIGLPDRPLGELHGDAAHRALTRAGATVRMQSKVTGLRHLEGGHLEGGHLGEGRAGGGWEVLTGESGESLDADAVVLAVPHREAAALLPDLPGAGSWAQLSATPIVNVHVVYDRPVTTLRFAAVVGSPVQWVFDRTAVAGARHGQYLAVSLSAADRYLAGRTEDLRAEFLPALRSLFPAAGVAQVTDFFVTREPRATFRQAPATRRLRPAPDTGLPGLVLAGAWTDTGWPDTMEGAVRSGEAAADLVDRHRRSRCTHTVEATA
jgi:squalene-associated FAD-dependent desaturase